MTPIAESPNTESRATCRWARMACTMLGACFLASCATTEQVNERKAAEVSQSANGESGGELSPPLKVLNFLGQFAAPNASYHGSF